MLKIIKIDFILFQASKAFLLFSSYQIAEYLIKLSIQISKNKNITYIKFLALIYAQNRNDKMFINTYKNFIKNQHLSKSEKFNAYINLGDAYAASKNYTKNEKIKKINNLKKNANLNSVKCYYNYLIFFIKKDNILNTNINFFKTSIKKKILKNVINHSNFFKKFLILVTKNIAPSYSMWLYLLYLLKKKKNYSINPYVINCKNNESSKFIILVSCSYNFLKIFGIFFIKQIRNLNDNNIIHFHVVDSLRINNNSFINKLESSFLNVNFTYGAKKIFNIGDTSSARYLICKDIMNYYKKDVLIADIDNYFYLSPENIIKKFNSYKYDMALFFHKKNSLPWERFSAGLSFFKYNNINSNKFLNDIISYINIAKNNKKEVLWGAETVAIYYAYYKNIKINKKIFDFSKILNIEDLILPLPKTLQFKKRITKQINSLSAVSNIFVMQYFLKKIYKIF